MNRNYNIIAAAAIGLAFMIAGSVNAQRFMEKLDRGLIAVKSGSGYYLSWRLFGTDPQDATFGFNVYKGSSKVNTSLITESTCYQDNSAGTGPYTVKPVTNGTEGAASEQALVLQQNYLEIPLQNVSGYTAGDASCGDLDGDGQYEVVLKEENSPKDNTGEGNTGQVKFTAYKLNGTKMWRIDLGINLREGAHYVQFMVYDLDGDGSAEIACKTAPGTKDGLGNYLKLGPAASADQTKDYRGSDGRIITGPEWYTIFSGKTGAELATVDYIPARGNLSGWGGIGGNNGNDNGTNRVDRFLACVAYLDGERPSVIPCRGYYGRSVLAAWDWRNGKLTNRWTFDSQDGTNPYSGMGNHNLSVGDVDQDGKDEIVYGSMCVDDNGKGLYTTGLRHGDAMHLGDLDPDRPGLEVFGIHENEAVIAGLPGWGAALFDAKTGEVIYGWDKAIDVGRGCADNVLADTKGCQCWWGAAHGLVSCKTGLTVGTVPSSTNFVIWWDGDLTRELLNSNSISKYGGSTLLTASGCSSINGSKSTPCLSVDIFGDWREEVIFSCGSSLRIYTTTTPTTNRIYTLMHDPQYRLAVAWQNVAYNQPPHTGFYLGYGMTLPAPKPNIKYYDGTMTSPDMPAYSFSRSSVTASMKVFGNRLTALPVRYNGMLKLVTVYDCSGKLLRKAIVKNNAVNLQKEFGVSDGVYMVNVNEAAAGERK
jgi:rhamnogalacturonan endolyase